MSDVSPPFKGTSARTSSDCNPDARIIIGSDELPMASMKVHARMTSAPSITRLADVEIPIVWGKSNGERRPVASEINAFTGAKPAHQHVRIDVKDPRAPDDADLADAPSGASRAVQQDPGVPSLYGSVMYGYVSAIGGGKREGTVGVKVKDYSALMQTVPASVSFDADATVANVVQYVREAFLDGQAVVDDLQVLGVPENVSFFELAKRADGVDIESLQDAEDDGPGAVHGFRVSSGRKQAQIDTKKRFKASNSSLLDVVAWIAELLDYRVFFYGQNPVSLVLERDPGRNFHDVGHVVPSSESSLPLHVRYNNALFTLNPQPLLTCRGHTKKSIRAQIDPTISTNTYPSVTVGYRPFLERLTEDVEPVVVGADTTTLKKCENVARQSLKDRLMSTAGGEMSVEPRPDITPFSRIEAVPVCDHQYPEVDVNPLRYEVQEVIFHARPVESESNGPFMECTLRVAPAVDPSKIEVTESKMIDV